MDSQGPDVELLKERNVQVTSRAARVGRSHTPIAALRHASVTERPIQRRILPMLMIVAGVPAALALLWSTGLVLVSILGGLGLIIAGAALYRERIVHEVHGHFHDGDTRMLLRSRDAAHVRRVQAALARAVALTDITVARASGESTRDL